MAQLNMDCKSKSDTLSGFTKGKPVKLRLTQPNVIDISLAQNFCSCPDPLPEVKVLVRETI